MGCGVTAGAPTIGCMKAARRQVSKATKSHGVMVVYVEMLEDERRALDHLVAITGAAAGRRTSLSEVVRQLVRNAVRRGKPVKLPRRSVE